MASSPSSYLVEETTKMGRMQRAAEQVGHRRLARVNAREHSNDDPQSGQGLEADSHNAMPEHPYFKDNQRFDGVDPNLNPEPPLNTAARTEYDNERREQEQEKQLRLGNMPQFSNAPKPRWP